MSLKIVKGSDPLTVENIILTYYGPPGQQKTTLAFTSHAPLLLDFDESAHRASFRGDIAVAKNWHDAATMQKADFEGYKTAVVDTAGRALDKLGVSIIENDPKMANKSGGLSLQGYGALGSQFKQWLDRLRSFGLDVVLVAHVEESGRGDDMVERIDAQGKSKQEIYKISDAMARIAIRNGKLQMLFSPTDTAFGKNPAQFDPITIPDLRTNRTFLGDIMDKIKASLNAMTEEQREVAQLLSDWTSHVSEATTLAGMNALLKDSNGVDPRIKDNAKRVLWNYAKEHNFEYNKEAKGFIEKIDEKPVEKPADVPPPQSAPATEPVQASLV